MSKVAYTVGRFQPPTIGHRMLIQATIDEAGPGGQAFVFVSKTVNNKDSPLPIDLKLPILQHMFEGQNVRFVDTSRDCSTPCGGPGAAFGWLLSRDIRPEQITFVIGKERLGNKEDPKYFGPEARLWGDDTKPRPAKFEPVGHSVYRDPSLEDKSAENMSGTKARAYVCAGRKEDFYTAVGYDLAAGEVGVVEAAFNEIKRVKCPTTGGVKRGFSQLDPMSDDVSPPTKKARVEEESVTMGGPDGERPIDTVKFVNEGTTYDLPIVVLRNTRLFRGIGKEQVDCGNIDPSQGELPYAWMTTDPQLARRYGNCVFQYEPTEGNPLRLLDIWSPTVIRLIDSISPGFNNASKRAWFRDYTGRTATKSQTVQKIGPINGGPTEKVNALTIFDESSFTDDGTALVWRGLTWGDKPGQFSRYSVADSDAWVTSLLFEIVNRTGLDGLYAPILPSHFHNGTSIQNVFDEEFIVLKSSLDSKYTVSRLQGGKRRKTRRNHKKSRFMSSKRMKGQSEQNHTKAYNG